MLKMEELPVKEVSGGGPWYRELNGYHLVSCSIVCTTGLFFDCLRSAAVY